MFIFRLAYGYYVYPDGVNHTYNYSFNSNHNYDFSVAKSNYASKKSEKIYIKPNHGISQIDQKYEKIATIGSVSDNFSTDLKKINSIINNYNALIQFEDNRKSTYNISRLSVGVRPDKFDEFVTDVRKVGKLISIEVNKKDKTNEYKTLNAKKLSLATNS